MWEFLLHCMTGSLRTALPVDVNSRPHVVVLPSAFTVFFTTCFMSFPLLHLHTNQLDVLLCLREVYIRVRCSVARVTLHPDKNQTTRQQVLCKKCAELWGPSAANDAQRAQEIAHNAVRFRDGMRTWVFHALMKHPIYSFEFNCHFAGFEKAFKRGVVKAPFQRVHLFRDGSYCMKRHEISISWGTVFKNIFLKHLTLIFEHVEKYHTRNRIRRRMQHWRQARSPRSLF